VLNPTLDEMLETQLDLVVAGTADAVLRWHRKPRNSTKTYARAVMFGHRHFQP